MITRFRVKNYKCLGEIDIPLTPVHVLIGQNDAGKSSLLEAMFALCELCRKQPSLKSPFPFIWQGRELVNNASKSPTISFQFEVLPVDSSRKALDYSIDLLFSPDGEVTVQRQRLNGQKLNPDTVPGPFFASQQGIPGVPLSEYIDVPPLAKCFRFQPKLMALPSAILPSTSFKLDRDGFGLPTLLADILTEDHTAFAQLESSFRSYFPHFSRIKLPTVEANARRSDEFGIDLQFAKTLGKQVVLSTRDGDIRLQQTSDGVILLLGFLALTYSPSPPGLILIEEPENGIYPKRLSEVVNLLKRFVNENPKAPQIIMTTHSPYLMSDFEPAEITFMCRGKGGSVKARPLRDAPLIKERLHKDFEYLGELWYNYEEDVIFGDAQPHPAH